MEVTAIVGAIVSVLGAGFSAAFAVWSLRAQTRREVGEQYDQMMRFRTDNPVVLPLSRQWTSEMWAKVYGPQQEGGPEWVTYYSYVELCIGYCNAVIISRKRLGREVYEEQHKRLVKLILTEHNPIIKDLLREGKYLSPYIAGFREALAREGWDWDAEHAALPM